MIKEKRKLGFWIAAVSTCFFVLWILGPNGHILERDSASYFPLANKEGVMLIYPLFLTLIRMIFGEYFFLDAAAMLQSIIAGICCISFMLFIRKQFTINRIEAYIILLFTLFPFTVTYPNSIITHEIMTESITYALFYPYVQYLIKSVFTGRKRDTCIQLLFAFILSMTRSQLRLVWAISACVIFYIGIKKMINSKSKCVYLAKLTLVTGIIFIVGVCSVTVADSTLRNLLFYRTATVESKEGNQIEVTADPAKEIAIETETVGTVQKPLTNKQGNSALMARIIYVSEMEDVNLFKNEELQGAFQSAYNAVDNAKHRYPYAEKGLWKWKYIAEACSKNPSLVWSSINAYFSELYKETEMVEQKTAEAYIEISNTLFKEHWIRYLGSTLTFLPSGFICTVFFQKEQIYLLCHIITLILYLLAIGGTITCFRSKEMKKKQAEFMLIILTICFCFVVITNLVFMGLQRYLIYPFGTFYIALYVLYKEIARKKLWKK